MKSRTRHARADREKAGGIYAGTIGFSVVWVVGKLHGVPFRDTIWKGIGCAIALYLLTTFLLRIVLRLPEEPEGAAEPAASPDRSETEA